MKKQKLTSQVDANVPSAYTMELYDLSPQRTVGSPIRASLVSCSLELDGRTIRHESYFLSRAASEEREASHTCSDFVFCNPYISVVLWSGVGFGFIQTYDEQAALDGLQDGLIVRINAYQILPGLQGKAAL